MIGSRAAFAFVALLSSAAFAAPPENVTITSTKSREVLDKFTKSFATPAIVTGKMARWERRVCPAVSGQNTRFNTFITQRVKVIAQAAGAPVEIQTCTPNIEIVFTTTPQALLDSVRKTNPDYLGWAASPAELDAAAKFTRPIQAWYTTETIDLNGARTVDSGMPLGEGIKMGSSDRPIFVPKLTRSNGNLINNAIHSGFNHVLIVIDSTKLAGRQVAPLADYISLLALTQLNSLDTCQPLPSIVNMLATACEHAPEGLTQFDLAYLQGLYRTNAGREMTLQRDEIADTMMNTVAKVK